MTRLLKLSSNKMLEGLKGTAHACRIIWLNCTGLPMVLPEPGVPMVRTHGKFGLLVEYTTLDSEESGAGGQGNGGGGVVF